MADAKPPAVVAATTAAHPQRAWTSNAFSWAALAFQVAIIVLYGTCTKFEHFIATDHANAVRAACAAPLATRYCHHHHHLHRRYPRHAPSHATTTTSHRPPQAGPETQLAPSHPPTSHPPRPAPRRSRRAPTASPPS